MTLAEERLTELSQDGGLLDQYHIRLNVVGRMELLPESLQKVVRRAEYMSRNNTRAILNLCISYTSRDEITTAVQTCVRNAIKSGANRNSIITENDINSQLQMSQVGSPPVDILIRTGGAKRLSDFLLWQGSTFHQFHTLRDLIFLHSAARTPRFISYDLFGLSLGFSILYLSSWTTRSKSGSVERNQFGIL
ncbi:putative undecaprenyl diphosphate synthase-domain-containing protein [Lyophyllum atratum]|nr:putative undecaprenyl diphosphate synthase-domain-containing protein [Lyophyllum atratum]